MLAGVEAALIRPLSNDLRERVVAVRVSGETCQPVAARFSVASTAVKLIAALPGEGIGGAGEGRRHRRPVLDAHRACIRSRID